MPTIPTIQRPATPTDAPAISALIMSVAHYFTVHPQGEGAEHFFASITPEAIVDRINNPAFDYHTAWNGEQLIGVIAMRESRHLYHLFVATDWHGHGIARRLWQGARERAIAAGNPGNFIVNASLYAVPVYERFGFQISGAKLEFHGIAAQPMSLVLTPAQP